MSGGLDLTEIRKDIENLLLDQMHDDGSYAPLLIRFAWHCCGTYDKEKGNGGSNGGTMRFETEQLDPENAGLRKARKILEPIKKKHPWISYADLYVLSGYVAIESSGGPHIRFSIGRQDYTDTEASHRYGPRKCPFGDGKYNPSGSRLPSADLGSKSGCPMHAAPHEKEAPTINAMRGTFERLGMTDKETVCLIILGHQYGRCHPHVSGYENAWYGFDPAHWSVYTRGLGYLSTYSMGVARNDYQPIVTQAGKRQWQSSFGKDFMMLAVNSLS